MEDEGGVQHQRHPGLPEQTIATNASDPSPDLAGGMDGDDDPAGDASAMNGGRLGSVGKAHAMNEGEHRRGPGDDLLPAF